MENFIGLNIKHLCVKNKLSQEAFGELFDLQKARISTYTSGRSNPPVEILQQICQHFKISLDDFVNINLETQKFADLSPVTHKIAEPPAEYVTQKDKTILAQEKTIATLEKQVALLEKTVDSLEAKLAKKAS